jgi:hypothetical protein
MAEKARKEALAGSNVKVVGADVMATKKLSLSIMLYPVFCLTFSATLFYLLSRL